MQHAQPNIVIIMADQMAFDAIGALGHPAVKTPHIDRLVRSGVTFVNAYCNSPLCAPARAAFVTGKHIHNIGVYDNGSELSAGTPTFVHHLRRVGYETALSGKMHFIGPDQLHGFEHRTMRDIHTAAFDLTPDWSKGVYPNPGTGVRRLRKPGVREINNNLDYDEQVLHRTLEQIRAFKRRKEQKPFFLCASFFHPHDPFHITETYWNLYAEADIPMPQAPADEPANMHPFNQWIQKHHELDTSPLTDEQTRLNRRAYYGMVSYFDDKVGQIVGELDRLGMLDNTIIAVTSDHGEMLGEHGMWFKRTFYDHATKIPLVVSWPGRFQVGKQVHEVVSLVDLAATVMSLANVPDCGEWIAGMDGDSFEPLLTGEADTGWKDEVLCEYFGEGPVQPLVMLRKGRYKYVEVHEQEPLLFDLDRDLLELDNLAPRPDYAPVCNTFRARIRQEVDWQHIRRDIMRSQRERLMIAESLRKGKVTVWDHRHDDQ